MSKASLVIVLAEDERHQRFVRHYLGRLGYERHDLRFEALPSGRGSGEQWVRERYGPAVEVYRERVVRAKTALIVVIDADIAAVTDRLQQFKKSLEDRGLNPRADREAIVHLIPKRHVETWVLCLNGQAVDEETDYSRNADVEHFIQPAALEFFAWTREGAAVPPHCIPSLKAAIPEMQRLE